MKYVIFTFLFFAISFNLLAQETEIEVADLSLKVPGLGNQEYYYGFEEGDELIFSFSERNKKEVKQVEIFEYPATLKYSGIQLTNSTKRIKINKRSIYLFKITNTAIGARECAVKITRIPANTASKSFNTNISWKQITDTTYTTITKKRNCQVRYNFFTSN